MLAVLVAIGAGVGIEAGLGVGGGPVPEGNAQPGVVPGPQALTPEQVAQQLEAALAEWAGFPVGARPRPLVLTGQIIVVPGFADGDAKLAFLEGAIDPPASFPPVPEVGFVREYPVISAEAAFRALVEVGSSTGAQAHSRLHVELVKFKSQQFVTDRGSPLLPAWTFSLSRALGPIAVLAVAPSAIYTPPAVARTAQVVGAAQLAGDGRTLTLTFFGAPDESGPCGAEYTVSVASSASAVAVVVVAHPHDTAASCLAPAATRTATVTLTAPLGARVLVDGASRSAVVVQQGNMPMPVG